MVTNNGLKFANRGDINNSFQKNAVQKIKNSDEENLEFHGFRKSSVRTTLTWIGYILSLGTLRLFYHWYPKYQLYSTHEKCSLHKAEKILVMEIYKERRKEFFVRPVSTIRSDSESRKLSYNLENGDRKESTDMRSFTFKKVSFIWDDAKEEFHKLSGVEVGKLKSDYHKMQGVDQIEQNIKRTIYGNNQIEVPLQSTLKLFALEALTPFYIFQVFSLIVWLAEFYYYYAVAIVIMSVFGLGSSVIQTRKNQKNLKGTVNKSGTVTVRRNGESEEISTDFLVPGDLMEIPAQGCLMYCDAVLLNGNCIVNESSLTGESVPVLKSSLPNTDISFNMSEDSNHVLYCGTTIIQTRYYGNEKVMALVLRTGFMTTKGQLVKSIMYPPPADFKFDQDSYKFILILTVIALLAVVYTIVSKSSRGISASDVIIKALDLITIVIPPALPAAMTVGKLFALRRLKNLHIYCINSRVINVSGSINCVCFDKTGTLTEDGLDMWGVIPVDHNKLQEPVKSGSYLDNNSLLLRGMVTCHSLTLINEKLEGDPLDLKMFESTEWILEEPSIPDTSKYDLFVPTIVKSKKADIEIGIIRQFQFSSTLQRMSVVTKALHTTHFELYCKGAPEMIITLSRPETVPPDITQQLVKYTEHGYRVIALARKILQLDTNLVRVEKLLREEVERDMEFLGLIVLENRLKKETSDVIQVLERANMKIVMITGDNIQTALSVAKECGIVSIKKSLVIVEAQDKTKNQEARLFYTISPPSIQNMMTDWSTTIDSERGQEQQNNDVQVAMTGNTWAIVKEHFPHEMKSLIAKGVVFARMTSDQKQQLVQALQLLGYYVAMCGDGTNDCGALKAAHVGISLSEAEASVASPFTAQEPNIRCVPNVIVEGRAALVTSYGIFKFMICYSLTEFISCLILYSIDSNLTSLEFLFIDICLIVHFTATFGLTDSYKKLSPRPPMTSLLSFIPLASILLQLSLVLIFQLTAYYVIQNYEWYKPFTYVPDSLDYKCFENYAVFAVSLFQYIIIAFVFSKGKPYRKPIYTNKILSSSILVMIAICLYIALEPAEWLTSILELMMPPQYDGKIMMLIFAGANLVLAVFFEELIVEVVLRKTVKPFLDRKFKKRKKGYLDCKELDLSKNQVSYTNFSYICDSIPSR